MKKKVARCFGIEDGIFAGHPSEVAEAFSLLSHCVKKSISMSDVEAEVTAFLKAKPANSAHIKKQIARVREHFGPWLS